MVGLIGCIGGFGKISSSSGDYSYLSFLFISE